MMLKTHGLTIRKVRKNRKFATLYALFSGSVICYVNSFVTLSGFEDESVPAHFESFS